MAKEKTSAQDKKTIPAKNIKKASPDAKSAMKDDSKKTCKTAAGEKNKTTKKTVVKKENSKEKEPVPQKATTKRRLVVSYQNLSAELLEVFKRKYIGGYLDQVIKVNAPNDKTFYAVTLDTPDASYLVKVDVKIDTMDDEDIPEPSFGDDDRIGTGTEDAANPFSETTDEDAENMPEEEV